VRQERPSQPAKQDQVATPSVVMPFKEAGDRAALVAPVAMRSVDLLHHQAEPDSAVSLRVDRQSVVRVAPGAA
jgi:hypothetical protein